MPWISLPSSLRTRAPLRVRTVVCPKACALLVPGRGRRVCAAIVRRFLDPSACRAGSGVLRILHREFFRELAAELRFFQRGRLRFPAGFNQTSSRKLRLVGRTSFRRGDLRLDHAAEEV